MSVVETLLVYVGSPVLIYAVLAVLVYGRGASRTSPRYRPGKGWAHEPVWYLPRPETSGAHAVAALTAGSPAVPARTARGGASGTW